MFKTKRANTDVSSFMGGVEEYQLQFGVLLLFWSELFKKKSTLV